MSGRPDDKDPAVIENRIDVYREKTEPIINYCRERGIYQPVNGMGSIEDIFGRLVGLYEKVLKLSIRHTPRPHAHQSKQYQHMNFVCRD